MNNIAFYLQGRQNISPDKIPWSALKTLMAQSIYGGRIDNEFDQRLLNTFLERLFTTLSFDSEFKLACKVDGHKDIQMPDGIRYRFFLMGMSMYNFLLKKNKNNQTIIHQTNLSLCCVNICLGQRITLPF